MIFGSKKTVNENVFEWKTNKIEIDQAAGYVHAFGTLIGGVSVRLKDIDTVTATVEPTSLRGALIMLGHGAELARLSVPFEIAKELQVWLLKNLGK